MAKHRMRPIADSFEIELKHFVASRQDLNKIRDILDKSHLLYNVHASRPVSHYFDTPAHDLYHTRKISVRVREANQTVPYPEMTIKTNGDIASGGTSLRREFEHAVSRVHPDFSVLEDREAKKLVRGVKEKDLADIFVSDAQRLAGLFDLMINGKKVVVEFALDDVVFYQPQKDGTQKELVRKYEFELEVKQKLSAPDLTKEEACRVIEIVAAEIKKEIPSMHLNGRSKAAVGYKAIGSAPAPALPPAPVIDLTPVANDNLRRRKPLLHPVSTRKVAAQRKP